MYICERCGHLVSEVPTESWRHTELEGAFYECDDMACDCGGDFVEACECECCGEYEAEEELLNGWCRCCVSELCEARGLDIKKDRSELFDIIEEELYEKSGVE